MTGRSRLCLCVCVCVYLCVCVCICVCVCVVSCTSKLEKYTQPNCHRQIQTWLLTPPCFHSANRFPPTRQNLLAALSECTEWGQVAILDALVAFSPRDAREAEHIIERILPRLVHANPAVVLSAVKIILLYMPKVRPQKRVTVCVNVWCSFRLRAGCAPNVSS